MPTITVYTKPGCGYCHAAKDLLGRKRLAFHEINIGADVGARAHMIERAGGRTTAPQIVVGETHVGGCDDLYELEAKGYLDRIIEEAAAVSSGAA